MAIEEYSAACMKEVARKTMQNINTIAAAIHAHQSESN